MSAYGVNAGGSRVKTMVRVGVLTALAFVLMWLEFHIPGFPPFLQYDASEVPSLLGGFAMGPLAGFSIVAGKCLLFLLSGKDEAGLIGTAANFVSAFPLVLTAAWVYSRLRTRAGAIAGLAAGLVITLIATSLGNYLVFLPAWGVPAAARMPTIWSALVPFNALKVLLTSAITLLLYKRVRDWLH